eukprot:1849257-Rhodomonas_salina.1
MMPVSWYHIGRNSYLNCNGHGTIGRSRDGFSTSLSDFDSWIRNYKCASFTKQIPPSGTAAVSTGTGSSKQKLLHGPNSRKQHHAPPPPARAAKKILTVTVPALTRTQ